LYWYDGDGDSAAPRLEELRDGDKSTGVPAWAKGSPAGALVIGDKDKIVHGVQGALNWQITSDSLMKEYIGDRTKATDPSWPNNIAHFQDWLQACKGWKPAGSNFDYGGPLAEIAMLGNIAHHMADTDLKWDAKHMTCPNQPKVNQYLHVQYRDGWTL